MTLIDAANIVNDRGTLAAGAMMLKAREDIDNLAATISAGKLAANAGRDINLTHDDATGSDRGRRGLPRAMYRGERRFGPRCGQRHVSGGTGYQCAGREHHGNRRPGYGRKARRQSRYGAGR
ncbi:hypothetical protein ACTMU2_07275 [Cupriavidus basilensis]